MTHIGPLNSQIRGGVVNKKTSSISIHDIKCTKKMTNLQAGGTLFDKYAFVRMETPSRLWAGTHSLSSVKQF